MSFDKALAAILFIVGLMLSVSGAFIVFGIGIALMLAGIVLAVLGWSLARGLSG